MTATLVIGDLHLKASSVLPRADALIERLAHERKADVGKVVLLGDYFDDWGQDVDRCKAENAALLSWVSRWREQREVACLMGNHDMAYLLGAAGSPGWLATAERTNRETLEALKPVMAATVGPILATHGGVCGSWARDCLGVDPEDGLNAADVANGLNALLAEGDYARLSGLGDEIDDRGPLWARPQRIEFDPLLSVGQVTGHTPVETVRCVTCVDGSPLWLCDTLSTERPEGYDLASGPAAEGDLWPRSGASTGDGWDEDGIDALIGDAWGEKEAGADAPHPYGDSSALLWTDARGAEVVALPE